MMVEESVHLALFGQLVAALPAASLVGLREWQAASRGGLGLHEVATRVIVMYYDILFYTILYYTVL